MSPKNCLAVYTGLLLTLHLFYWTCGLVLVAISVWSVLDPTRGVILTLIAALGQDLLQLICFALFIAGSWIFAVGLVGTIGIRNYILKMILDRTGFKWNIWIQDLNRTNLIFIAEILFLIGIVQRRKYLIVSCGVLLATLIFVENLIMLLIWINAESIQFTFRDVLKKRLVVEYGKPEFSTFIKAVDFVQNKHLCCGIEHWSDYTENTQLSWRRRDLPSFSTFQLIVPRTCCKLLNQESYRAWKEPQPENLVACQSNISEIYSLYRWSQGCYSRIDSWINLHQKPFGLTIASVSIMQWLTLYLTVKVFKKMVEIKKPVYL
ncbi:tetraspanin-9 [Eurytemora carolleeae]|uniref:tetraspanin-9 n=1 Tax=Eurytemora carolleeae TaxID=1294199 RepID=UPI000C7630A1|nr:tetraspanin-9 [Eurytemora carolleeae]|eukprot:XP_023328703.1 tetraspanin-9-like [Eurytemora affinis]